MTFADALRSGRALLMDGAMGTELIRRGYAGPTWRANLEAPELVATIHAEYAAAGAEVVLTNTFMMAEADSPQQIGTAAVALARRTGRWVLGSLATSSRRADDPNVEKILACVRSLTAVDGVLLETCSDRHAFTIAHAISKEFSALPVLISFAFAPGESEKMIRLARAADASAIAALGVNCGREQSAADIWQTLDLFRGATRKPLFARPNAGSPQRADGRWTYPLNPGDWALATAQLCDRGLAMIGGCCGTTPQFIGELSRLVTSSNERRKDPSPLLGASGKRAADDNP